MTDAQDLAGFTNLTSQGVSPDSYQITASADALDPPVRAIRCEGAGTLTVKTAKSGATTRTLNFHDGETRYVAVTHVTAITGPTFVEGMP